MKKRFIISGGGTGGHIFPAVAIANGLKSRIPDAEILFIGAKNKMEMKRVPEAGYPIVGLTIYGISRDRSLHGLWANIKLPFVLLKSMRIAKKTIRRFKPDTVIGVGGFASGPTLKVANMLKIPTLIQEQNSYPGITNKLLAPKVNKICVAYDGLETYFPKEKIVKTGNPIRSEILLLDKKNDAAYQFFEFNKEKKTLLVVGGSLGARTINECMVNGIEQLKKQNIQIIWQTGEEFYKNISAEILSYQDESTKIVPFIKNMNDAYSVADYIVSRAGALAIAELCVVGAPTILVPFPFAAEDHQTKNAEALSLHDAAILISDNQAADKLVAAIMQLLQDEQKCKQLSDNIKRFAQPNAIDLIVQEIINL